MDRIIGRRSSLFTRPVLMFAETLAIPYEFAPVHDLTSQDSSAYGSNPALKLPVLHGDNGELFGALNICRAFADRADEEAAPDPGPRIVWPEDSSVWGRCGTRNDRKIDAIAGIDLYDIDLALSSLDARFRRSMVPPGGVHPSST